MTSLGDSQLNDGALRVNEFDPFTSFSTGQGSAANTASKTLTRGPLNFAAEPFEDSFDPSQPPRSGHVNPFKQAGLVDTFYDQQDPLLNLTGVGRTTFQVLDSSVDSYQQHSGYTTLVPFTNPSGMVTSLDLAPTRVMPGEYFEEDTDALVLGASIHSPRHHENEETSRLMSELQIDERESQIFFDVLELTLRADLPPPWKKKFDQSGATYYLDVDNETSTYSCPLLPYVRQIVEAWRMYLKKPFGKFFEWSKDNLWKCHAKELKGWHGPLKDGNGHSYFWNSESRRSTWHDPRLTAQHYFDFQCSLVRHLETRLTATQDTDEGPFDASKPPWEMQRLAIEAGSCDASSRPPRQTGYNSALSLPERILENQQLMLADQPQPLNAIRENHIATKAEEEVQRAKLTEKRVQKLEDKKARDMGRPATGSAEAILQHIPNASVNSASHMEQSFQRDNQSNSADWIRGATGADESVQRVRLPEKRVQQLEDKSVRDVQQLEDMIVRDTGRGLAENILDPARNSAVFLVSAPINIKDPLSNAAPLESQNQQARPHAGWQSWEMWTK